MVMEGSLLQVSSRLPGRVDRQWAVVFEAVFVSVWWAVETRESIFLYNEHPCIVPNVFSPVRAHHSLTCVH